MGSYSVRGQGLVAGNRVVFLGILSAMMARKEDIDIELASIKVPEFKYSQLLNLGIVFKSKLIVELIEKVIKEKTF